MLALAVVLGGGFMHYRDPTLLSRTMNAQRLALPWEPRLLPDGPLSELVPERSLPVWQPFRSARAVPEVETDAGRVDESEQLTPEQAAERAANYEKWLREQGLTRLNELEQSD